MESNCTYSAYPDSNASTPRSREVDCETASYDDHPNPNTNYKVKLMCSYGGKILPRPHDNQLTYIGGDTKILTVDRNIRYASISHKLNSLTDSSDNCFKYQLPGEDLDALISVTNDEDLDHMMTEYDRIYRSSTKPVRLRLFMFSVSPTTFDGGESKTEQQWFVDALNAVQISSARGSLPASENTDFLFGFDKGTANVQAPAKVQDASAVVVAQTNVPELARIGSECGSEDSNSNRQAISDPVVSPTVEIQRQMQEYQMMQMAAAHDQQAISIDPRSYYGDYYTQKIQPAPAMTGQPRYWQEPRHMTTGGYQMSVAGTDSPVYLIPSSTSVYPPVATPAAAQTLRPATPASQGQTYYGVQRMANSSEFYREQGTLTQLKAGTYQQEAIGMVRPQAEMGYGQVYYTTSQSQGGMAPGYQPVVDIRQGFGTLAVNQEGKMVVNPNKVPS